MPSEDKIYEEFLIDIFSGNLSEENQQRLSDLLHSNQEFKARFEEMLKLQALSMVPAIESGKQANYASILDKIKSDPSSHRSGFRFSSLKNIAAGFILIVSVSLAIIYGYSDLTSPDDTAFYFETFSPVGSQTKIILPDSSIVWLNSASSLKYNKAYGKKSREVTLDGEGYFEVANKDVPPFVVRTSALTVNVLGTVFNVRAYTEDENVTVNLINGSVNLSLPTTGSPGMYRMKPNEQVVFNKQTQQFESSQTDATRSALWTTGKLCFVDATFGQITRDLERKYDVAIQIADNSIKSEMFSGSIDINLSLKEVLDYIDVDKKFTIRQQGDTLVIEKKQ
jgi:transmembrane sensor